MAPGPDRADRPLAELAERLRGEVVRPGESGYDDARRVWNARIDRRPWGIVRCRGPADVMATVAFANRHDVDVSVKGGGHHVSGSAVPEGGLMLDLGAIADVRVDPVDRTLRVGPGARWGQVDHETQAFGLAVPGGQDPNIGVAGLTLGGGVGWLSRAHGLTCDNLLAADVVTADGELVLASETTHPDLLWALRGGGGAVGVVTSFKFRLHEVGPEVFAGSLVYPREAFDDVARAYASFMADAPREARLLLGSMVLPSWSIYPESVHGTRVTMLIACYAGDPEAGRRALEPLLDRTDPIAHTLRARPYVEWQGAGESDPHRRTYVRSQYLDEVTDAAIDAVTDAVSRAPSSGATIFVSPRGGAETDPAPDACAFPHRRDAHHLLVETRWDDPEADERHVAWTRSVARALVPHTTGAVALNFLTGDEPPERARAAFGGNFDRLVEVAAAWDPENRFRMNPHLERAMAAEGR